MCEVGRGEGGKVCYVVQKEGKQKSVSVSETLTHVLKSLNGNYALKYTFKNMYLHDNHLHTCISR